MKKIFIAVLILYFPFIAFCQSNYLKLLEKKNYSKLNKKLNKNYAKDSNDIALTYIYARLYNKNDFKNFNPEKAYYYIKKTKNLFSNITTEKDIKSLNKIQINNLEIKNNIDSICYNIYAIYKNKNTIEGYEHYISHYNDVFVLVTNAEQLRDILAYNNASKINTIESFQQFIYKYPSAIQISDAIKNRNMLAYFEANKENTIDALNAFILKYPDAVEIDSAWQKIHVLSFEDAKKQNSSSAFQKFMLSYPNSKQYNDAEQNYEKLFFYENTKVGNIESYKNFLNKNYTNSHIKAAQDSIYAISIQNKDLVNLEYFITNFKTNSNYNNAFLVFYNTFITDGELSTIELFEEKYPEFPMKEKIEADKEIAQLLSSEDLVKKYSDLDFGKYDSYIKKAAPKELAFVALQRMIETDIKNKNYTSALKKIGKYETYFGEDNKKIKILKELLSSPIDNTIKVNSFGNTVNTDKGEYSPVMTADDKYLYFCGKGRKDNLSGEDIFVSENMKSYWSSPKLVDDLCSYGNDAPVSVSTDGTQMILFRNGKLYFSSKTQTGWSEPELFPYPINDENWIADAMITSDGKNIIFASVRDAVQNKNHTKGLYYYHGDGQYYGPDTRGYDINIFVSNKTDDGWATPINLGNNINTPYCDRSPFLHPDMKTLYFSSDGHGGFGGMDVYKSTRLADTCWTCWSEPVNLGKEINTVRDDWGYKITTDGKKAYFASKAENSEYEDLLWLNLPASMRPDYVATISGKLIDRKKKPVEAKIIWEDLNTKQNVGESKSDPSDGSFFIVLPLGKIYGFYVEKDEYFPISDNIDLRNIDKPIKQEENIDMITFKEMIDEGIAVPVNNLFFNFAESALLPYSIPELKRVAKIIKSNKLKVEISGHTDNVGDSLSNMQISVKRAISVKDFLVLEGCNIDDFSVVGYGDIRPIANNNSEEGRAKNRRVELKFVK